MGTKHKPVMKSVHSARMLLLLAVLVVLLVLFVRSSNRPVDDGTGNASCVEGFYDFLVQGQNIPLYQGISYIVVNNDEPFFTSEELSVADDYEIYSALDEFGRASGACALVTKDTLPDYDREELQYKPTGWMQANYDFIDNGGWLYNRCHLIGFRLTGQQDNPCNLITGTRQFNLAMASFESQVLQYVTCYNGQVLYRVTPYYENDNMLASGVLIESCSIEHSDEATFCVFVYNVQDGVVIDYETGRSEINYEEASMQSN